VLTKSKKKHPSTNKDASDDSVVQKKPTASRHLLLVRHGQYNVDGETDNKRTLTPLGWFCYGVKLPCFSKTSFFYFWKTLMKYQHILVIFGSHYPEGTRHQKNLQTIAAPPQEVQIYF